MEEALRAHLLAAAEVTALVGRRIDWGLRATGAGLPAVRLFESVSVPQMNLAAASSWTRSRVQCEAWGRSYRDARNVADLMSDALHGLRDTILDTRLRTSILARRSDDDRDDAGPLFRTALDVLVWHAPA